MCGIVGIVSAAAPPDRALVERMAQCIAHRGPDDAGLFADGPAALGFRRLSIIDLSGGHQPLTSACGRFTIVFNGEIYNFADIRAELERDHGIAFRTHSDTEVLIEGYARWGAAVLPRLNGMFAFAVWDCDTRTLFCARDRFGKKPFYYAPVTGGFAFASEIRALHLHPQIPRALDRERVPAYLAYRYVPGDETLFAGIQALPPGHTLTWSESGGLPAPAPWWHLPFADAQPLDASVPPRDAARQLLALLSDAVRLRMISDVPFGAFLSGGIDSSFIVALMAQHHPQPVRTFSIGFDTGFSEESYARLVAERFGADHNEIIVTASDLLAAHDGTLAARETPITEPSDIPLYLLAHLARQHVTVVLSGEGSDELFAGYPKHVFEQWWRAHLHLGPRAAGAARAVLGLLPVPARGLRIALEAMAQPDPFESRALWFGAFAPAARRQLFAGSGLEDLDPHATPRARALRFPTHLASLLDDDCRYWLPANLLLRGDRMTMAHSLELRCPFLDCRIANFAALLPDRFRVRGLSGKWLLKEAAADLLPPSIIRRKKWGFRVPVSEWFRGPLRAQLQETLLGEHAALAPLHPAPVARLVTEHLAAHRDHGKALWTLYEFARWRRHWNV